MTTLVQSTSRIAEYISIRPSIATKKHRSTFFQLAQQDILPKTGISESVAANFDEYIYAK
jgi:hypothetical protein